MWECMKACLSRLYYLMYEVGVNVNKMEKQHRCVLIKLCPFSLLMISYQITTAHTMYYLSV